MFNLTPKQQDEIGLSFILRRLQPATPYGIEKAKKIAPLTTEEAEICFNNIQTVGWVPVPDLTTTLAHFKNIRGCIEKAKSLPLNEVELFEVKGFLLTLERLLATEIPHLQGITLIPMGDALNILDPQNQRLAPFSLQSPVLAELRKEKNRLEAQNLMEQRAKIVAAEDAEERQVMEGLTDALRPHIPAFLHNMEAIGNLDLTMAKARLAKDLGAVRPTIGNAVALTEMANPYFTDNLAQKGKVFTKISMDMPEGITVITGANMGGKSMAIKTAVLNIVLCQLGFFVFAKTAQIPMFDHIHLIADDAQSAQEGLSTFGGEIARINTAISALNKGLTFLAVDEPARGTNPAEATAIVQGLTSYLSRQNAVSLISTHYDRITPYATAHYRVAGLSETGNMDYTLHPAGIDDPIPRNALDICKKMGLDEELLSTIQARMAQNH
ncbi:MAG: hypothetical protein FWE21_07685 [Defluviitaleaceae bacterium]|nr:hypothetical protein [Defluviitaleaceae bacterium]